MKQRQSQECLIHIPWPHKYTRLGSTIKQTSVLPPPPIYNPRALKWVHAARIPTHKGVALLRCHKAQQILTHKIPGAAVESGIPTLGNTEESSYKVAHSARPVSFFIKTQHSLKALTWKKNSVPANRDFFLPHCRLYRFKYRFSFH